MRKDTHILVDSLADNLHRQIGNYEARKLAFDIWALAYAVASDICGTAPPGDKEPQTRADTTEVDFLLGLVDEFSKSAHHCGNVMGEHTTTCSGDYDHLKAMIRLYVHKEKQYKTQNS